MLLIRSPCCGKHSFVLWMIFGVQVYKIKQLLLYCPSPQRFGDSCQCPINTSDPQKSVAVVDAELKFRLYLLLSLL